jgi:very-short-patch-repair endonuclease
MAGRPGVAVLRCVTDAHRDRGAATQSKLEVIVSRAVTSGRLPPANYQHPVIIGGRTFHLDLAWPDERVFLEADGAAYHRTRKDFFNDRARQNLLVVARWRPLRYTWPVANEQPELIVAQVGAALDERQRSAAR